MTQAPAHRPRSILDGFFTPSSPDDVLAALDAVADHDDDDGAASGRVDRSFGQVTSPETLHGGRPSRGGLLCERIFGPVEALRCRCGMLSGEAHRDEACPKCGVLCADPSLRSWRFGHLEVPSGVVHPLFLAHAARVLDDDDPLGYRRLGDDDVEAERLGAAQLARRLDDAGAPRWLVEHLVITRVPVLPVGDRPPVADLTAGMLDPWPGPQNDAWASLVARANRAARLLELDAPDIIVVNERRLVQEAFDEVMRTVSERRALEAPKRFYPLAVAPDEDDASVGSTSLFDDGTRRFEIDDDAITGLLFLDDGSLLVHTLARLSCVRPDDGAVSFSVPPSLHVVQTVCGRFVTCGTGHHHPAIHALEGEPFEYQGGTQLDVSVLDVQERRWLATLPPPGSFRRVLVENEQPEDLLLRDFLSGVIKPLRYGGDRPGCMAVTRDGRFALVGDPDDAAVIELDTAMPLVHRRLPESGRALLVDSLGRVSTADDDDDDNDSFGAGALCLRPDGRWCALDPLGRLSDLERVSARFTFSPAAAALDADGARLALAAGRTVHVFAIDDDAPPRLLARFVLGSDA